MNQSSSMGKSKIGVSGGLREEGQGDDLRLNSPLMAGDLGQAKFSFGRKTYSHTTMKSKTFAGD